MDPHRDSTVEYCAVSLHKYSETIHSTAHAKIRYVFLCLNAVLVLDSIILRCSEHSSCVLQNMLRAYSSLVCVCGVQFCVCCNLRSHVHSQCCRLTCTKPMLCVAADASTAVIVSRKPVYVCPQPRLTTTCAAYHT